MKYYIYTTLGQHQDYHLQVLYTQKFISKWQESVSQSKKVAACDTLEQIVE